MKSYFHTSVTTEEDGMGSYPCIHRRGLKDVDLEASGNRD